MATANITFTSVQKRMSPLMKTEEDMFVSVLLWFASLAVTHGFLSLGSHDSLRIQNALFQFGTGGLLVPALYLVGTYSECVSAVFASILFASVRFGRNYVWRLPMLLCAMFVGIPIESVALWCAVLSSGNVGRTIIQIFDGFDARFLGIMLYGVSRYLFLLRVLWAVMDGPLHENWEMTAAGMPCVVLVVHDFGVLGKMVNRVRL